MKTFIQAKAFWNQSIFSARIYTILYILYNTVYIVHIAQYRIYCRTEDGLIPKSFCLNNYSNLIYFVWFITLFIMANLSKYQFILEEYIPFQKIQSIQLYFCQ